MRFHGFCSYPHGGYVTLGLFLACCGGLASTGYALISCRFVVVRFFSDLGDFDQLYNNQGAGDVLVRYQIAAGFFSWLRPLQLSTLDQVLQWNVGTCAGYTQTQRSNDAFFDDVFEAVRVLAVVAVLLAVAVLLWIILLGCLSLERCYIGLLSTTFLLLSALVSLCFLVLRSGLCNNVGTTPPTECELDEGGLVAVAASILWFVAFLITILFVSPVDEDEQPVEMDRRDLLDVAALRASFAERIASRKRSQERKRQERLDRKRERDARAVLERERRKDGILMTTPSKDDEQPPQQEVYTPGTLATVEGDDGETEVYIRRRLDNIEHMVDDEDPHHFQYDGMREI